jgi:ABC-type multidrug transport system fused ATPase/permease subunit
MDASMEEVEAAVRAAQLTAFVDRLPKGYDTVRKPRLHRATAGFEALWESSSSR